jgi:hypothetical protein
MKEPCELEKLNAVAQRNGVREPFGSVALIVYCVVLMLDGFGYCPGGWIRRATLALLVGTCMFELIRLIRIARAYLLSRNPSSASARERIENWKAHLESSTVPPDIIEFDAGDFWGDGRATIRLLQDDNWIVLAYFRHRVISQKSFICVFDAQATPLLYSPDQRRIRLGKRKFRKVEVRTESQPSFQKLARVVATA